MPITIGDVAKQAGVSRATVSRVLAGHPHISPEVRARVKAAAQQLNYHPSRVARSLRAQKTRIIGLIISDIQNPFYPGLVRALEDLAYANGYTVFLCNSDESIDKEVLYLQTMRAERVSGVVITPTRETDNPSRCLLEANIPVVAVDRKMADLDVDTVVIDNVSAACELAEHLIRNGHHRIGAVFGPATITTSRERHEGYRRALGLHGIQEAESLVRVGVPKEPFGYESAKDLLSLPEPPTALLLANNLLALGAMRAIHELGLRIPEDVCLATFDNEAWTAFAQPPLTVIDQPTYELGRRAGELLFRRIADSSSTDVTPAHTLVTLQAQLIIRGSSVRPASQPS